jgi:hypothetical protein
MALVESCIDIGKELVSSINRLSDEFAHLRTKSPRFSSLSVMMSMCSEERQERANLIGPEDKFIVWRVIKEPRYI